MKISKLLAVDPLHWLQSGPYKSQITYKEMVQVSPLAKNFMRHNALRNLNELGHMN